MTPLMLQDELVEEVKNLLSGHLYKTPAGECIPINVYPQNLPVNETDDDADPIPYVIVRLNSGEDKSEGDSNNTVKLVLIIATWDDALNNQGYRDVLNIIQKIYHRFEMNPNLNGVGVFNGAFKWAIQDDNYYPYNFGACELNFHIAAVRREDPFA